MKYFVTRYAFLHTLNISLNWSAEVSLLFLYLKNIKSKWRLPQHHLKQESQCVAAVGAPRQAGLLPPQAHVSQEEEAQRGREGCTAAPAAGLAGL